MGSDCLIDGEFGKKGKEVLEMDDGNGFTTVEMHLKPLNCILKNG